MSLVFYCVSTWSFANTMVIPEVNLHPIQGAAKKQTETLQATHITREEIKNAPLINLSELLKQEQSIVRITNNSGDNSQSALSIRGFGDNAAANSLILVDGFPLTNPSLLSPNFNSIALSDIERIDIFQGSEGSLWGDQAVGGVINIITRHPEKFIGSLNAGLGSFNKKFYNAFVGSKFETGFFFKAFGFTNETDNYRQHNDQTDKTVSLQTGMDYARGTLSVNMQSYDNTVEFPGGLTQAQYDTNPRQATNFTNNSHFTNQVIQLLSKHEFGSDWILETRVAHHQIDGDGFIYLSFNRNEWENTFNPRLVGTLLNNKVILGFYGENSRYDLSNLKVQDQAETWQHDWYAQTTGSVIDNVDVTWGVRSASQNNSDESSSHVVVSEQSIAFHPNSDWQVFIRRDGNFRFPKANEEMWVSSSESSLQAQTGVSYESGVSWKTERQKSQLSIYRLKLHNEIAFNPTQTETDPFGSFGNLDETLRDGVTATESFHMTPSLVVDGQINYVRALYASGPFAGQLIPAVPAFNGNAGLGYEFASNWRAKYEELYTGSRFASEDNANLGKKLPGYWLTSVSVQHTIMSADIGFEVNNLFNELYSTYTLYNAANQTNTYYPGAGRSYLLTIKANIE